MKLLPKIFLTLVFLITSTAFADCKTKKEYKYQVKITGSQVFSVYTCDRLFESGAEVCKVVFSQTTDEGACIDTVIFGDHMVEITRNK